MFTKRSLLLATKSWTIPIIELLYEDIRIGTVAAVKCLQTALIGPSKEDGAGNRNLYGVGRGWWTKRFDFLPQSQIEEKACFAYLPSIVAHFPNLTILNLADYSLPIRPIPASILPNLRFVSTRTDRSNPIYFPNIHTLIIHLTTDIGQTYPNLTFLEMHIIHRPIIAPSAFSRYIFPQLRHFSARYGPSMRECMDNIVTHFLETHGPQLVSLALGSVEDVRKVNAMLQSTPHIKELTLNSSLHWALLHCLAPVTHLGLVHFEGVVDLTGLTLAQLPKLEAIQLVDTAIKDLVLFADPGDICLDISCPELREKVKVEDVFGQDMPFIVEL